MEILIVRKSKKKRGARAFRWHLYKLINYKESELF